MSGFCGHGYGWSSYMDASHCWLGMKDFSDYRRVKVKAGTDFGKLRAKKDFEITCAWWNTRFSDSYEKGDTVTAHVGIREFDWSYGHFQFSKADSDEDIIKNLGWNFQSIWGLYIVGRHNNEFSPEAIGRFKDYLKEREPFFWVKLGKEFDYTVPEWKKLIEIPFTETFSSFFKKCQDVGAISYWNGQKKSEIIENMIKYFWNPSVTGVKIDKERLKAVVDDSQIGWLVPSRDDFCIPSRLDPHINISFLSTFDRDYTKYKELVEHLTKNGLAPVPLKELKAAEDAFWAKQAAENAKARKAEEAKKKTIRDAYKGKWWLVKWSGNWADEIDLTAASVMKDSELKKFRKDMRSAGDFTVSIGTNQELETSGEDYLAGCEFIEIKDKSVREFLLEHCDGTDNWAPCRVWENA